MTEEVARKVTEEVTKKVTEAVTEEMDKEFAAKLEKLERERERDREQLAIGLMSEGLSVDTVAKLLKLPESVVQSLSERQNVE